MLKIIKSLVVRTSVALYIGVLCLFVWTQPVSAAQLQPQIPADAKVGDTITIPIILDSKGESINAIEGFLHYDPSLALKEIRDGNSVIVFWVERPSIEKGLVEDSFVRFSGITPGGFVGSGEAFSLVFTVTKEGGHTFWLQAARALLNDGQGTETTLTIGKAPVGGVPTQNGAIVQNDKTPPDTFTPSVSSDSNLYDGKQVVIFATQDKGSGIDHYEVAEREGFKALFFGALNYKPAVSPHILDDQHLRSYIFVKAVDRAGNERVVSLSPEHLPLYYNVDVLALILLVMFLLGFVWWHHAKRTLK